ncbi:hypothetical protein [Loktanella sp. SALINAS62]|uniref:hypothetical protein n=1 Tax=Loktanella sp. SALINAS62 TaxID=2706124 RepID=UPI001B8C1E9A|nr:hypothetical protein [Loktanella sp. SALINAS62]MBS1303307.1 hypothetical protein [Loktanella sp. SALINAS62]
MIADMFLFWLVVFLYLTAIFSLPAWHYTRGRRFYRDQSAFRYAPSAAAALAALPIIFLFWIGLLAIWWPWHLSIT